MADMNEITRFDLFMVMAPNPSDEEISTQHKIDRMNNPHNDHHKPKIRERAEIIVDYKFNFAKLMINKASTY